MRPRMLRSVAAACLAFTAAATSAQPAEVSEAAPAGVEFRGPEILANIRALSPREGDDRPVVTRTLDVRAGVFAPTRVHRIVGRPRLLELLTGAGDDLAQGLEPPAYNFRDTPGGAMSDWRWPDTRQTSPSYLSVSLSDLGRLPATIERVAMRVRVQVVTSITHAAVPLAETDGFVPAGDGVEIAVRSVGENPATPRGVSIAFRVIGPIGERPRIGRIELVDAAGRVASIAHQSSLIDTDNEAIGEVTEWRAAGGRVGEGSTVRISLIAGATMHDVVVAARDIDLLGR